MDQNQQQDQNNPMGQPVAGQPVMPGDVSGQPTQPVQPTEPVATPTAEPQTEPVPEPMAPGGGDVSSQTGENPNGGQTPPTPPVTPTA
jgi:hypothetical protein